MSARSMRSEYQALRSHDDETVAEEPRVSTSTAPTQNQRHTVRPGSIDLTKLDNAFKRLVYCHSAPLSLIKSLKVDGVHSTESQT